jgi:hypothetical protein
MTGQGWQQGQSLRGAVGLSQHRRARSAPVAVVLPVLGNTARRRPLRSLDQSDGAVPKR